MFKIPRNLANSLRWKCAGIAVSSSLSLLPATAQQPNPEKSIDQQAVSLLETKCQGCHNSKMKLGELALDSYDAVRKGGTHGTSVIEGDADKSRLYRRVARLEEPAMPMGGDPLPANEIELIKKWIESGAKWPSAQESAAPEQTEQAAVEIPDTPQAKFFHEQIQPILVKCQSCHDDALKYAGLTLESREGMLYGGLKGRALVPGNAEASTLYLKAARLVPHFMPVGAVMVSEQEIAALKKWIDDGAVWPDPREAKREADRDAQVARLKPFEDKEFTAKDRQWWAFQKVQRPAVPTVKNTARVNNEVDSFVVAAQEAKGLKSVPAADRETLLRRLYFDLTGLPPTPEEREAFLADKSPDAYPRLVEKLLASRAYGERWGRYWLDIARYADSNGYEYDKLRPDAWRYRDYVIRSFNEDRPYDKFIREQLAGDELPDRDYDSIVALSFLRMGPFIGDMAFMQNEDTRQDELDDIVSTTGSAFLGLTVGCARCHNHKYDPIAQKDYYRMIAVFAPTVRKDIPLMPPDLAAKYNEETAEIDRKIEDLKYKVFSIQDPVRKKLLEEKYKELPEALQIAIHTPPEKRNETQKIQAKEIGASIGVSQDDIMKAATEADREQAIKWQEEIKTLEASRPKVPMAMAIADMGPDPRPSYFLHRGSTRSKGSELEPGTLAVLHEPGKDIEFPKAGPDGKTSGRRLALANWIASPDNPLTARVMVNRIWEHHFGRGIVGSSSNFGVMGEPPTHPELLDWLASEFVKQGWKMKAIHRLILLSQTYQQASVFASPENAQIDPDNHLLWKMPFRRLEGEAIRDSILAVSGGLNRQAGGPAVFPEVDPDVVESSPNGADYQRWPNQPDGPAVWKRSVYVAVMRTITPPVLDLFDPPDKISSCARRSVTTVPTQALEMMNNKFITTQAALFAERVRNEAGADSSAQVKRAFVLALGRHPKPAELDESLRYLYAQRAYYTTHDEELKKQGVDPQKIPPPEMGSLTDLCHGLLNINEFIYIN